MRTASVCEALAELVRQGIVAQDLRGYRLNPAQAA
jgi:DNA-binding IclR family transcriptional regulator